MSATTALIILALIAWILQTGLSWLQIKRFNNAFSSMKKGMYIGIGRSNLGRFKPRVLIALSFDEHQCVVDSILMKGITVFAQPKSIDSLYGMHLSQIEPKKIFPNQSASQSALSAALTTK